MHTCMPANSVFDGPVTNLLSILCILAEVLSRAHAKRGNSRNDFYSGTSIGHFSSDGAASTAAKGLRVQKKLGEKTLIGSGKQNACIYLGVGGGGKV